MNKTVIHFPGLTELRGIAAVTVVIFHIDQFHYLFDIQSIGLNGFSFAADAVTFFFVLSGFLITYLLIEEKKSSGTVNVRKFYIRRILRIWPVYFLTLLISLLLTYPGIIHPPENTWLSIVLYIVMTPNIANALGIAFLSITPLWSVGVEEQFYVIWPWIIKKGDSVKKNLRLIVIIYIMLKVFLWIYDKEGGEYALIVLTRIDCMAMGGLFAYWLTEKKYLHLWYKRDVQWICYVTALLLSFLSRFPGNLDIEIKAVCYGIIILNVATNKQSIIRMDNVILRLLGTVSYGIYCYHMIIFFIIGFMLKHSFLKIFYGHDFIISAILIALTVLTATTSFYLIEKPLIGLKSKFGGTSHM